MLETLDLGPEQIQVQDLNENLLWDIWTRTGSQVQWLMTLVCAKDDVTRELERLGLFKRLNDAIMFTPMIVGQSPHTTFRQLQARGRLQDTLRLMGPDRRVGALPRQPLMRLSAAEINRIIDLAKHLWLFEGHWTRLRMGQESDASLVQRVQTEVDRTLAHFVRDNGAVFGEIRTQALVSLTAEDRMVITYTGLLADLLRTVSFYNKQDLISEIHLADYLQRWDKMQSALVVQNEKPI